MPQIELTQNEWLASHQWDQNIPCPMGKRLDFWQAKLTDIFGRVNGQPMLRVVWGQSPDTWHFNRYRKDFTPKYDWGYTFEYWTPPGHTIQVQKRKWIGLPRLIVERAAKPRVVVTADTFDTDGRSVAAERLDGPVEYHILPVYGILLQHSSIQDRNGNSLCCARAKDAGLSKCYGAYREIDQRDIDTFKQVLAEEDAKASIEESRIAIVGSTDK